MQTEANELADWPSELTLLYGQLKQQGRQALDPLVFADVSILFRGWNSSISCTAFDAAHEFDWPQTNQTQHIMVVALC